MTKSKSNLTAFIFARGGSKGIKDKNIIDFNGIPLIARTINQAKGVKRINRVVVSTDSERIAKIAKSFGAEVPFLRPKYLSIDNCSELLAWKHSIKYFLKYFGNLPDPFISLPTTSPLRNVNDINKCINLYLKSNIDGVVTITDAKKNPEFNIIKISKNKNVKIAIQPKTSPINRQKASKYFEITTVAYVFNPKYILDDNSLMAGNIKGVYIPQERSIDIDNITDLKIARILHSELYEKNFKKNKI